MSSKPGWKDAVLNHCTPRSEVPFSEYEYRERLTRIRSSMRMNGIDLLFLSSPESMFYVSGYQAEWYQAQSPDIWPPASGIAVHADRDDFILFDTEEELVMSRYTTVSKDTRIFPDDGSCDMLSWIVRSLREEGWLPARVGLEMRSYRPSRAVSELFQRRLEKEGCEVSDGSDIVRLLRRVKSPQELDFVKRASEIADVGMNAAIETIRPGMTELQVYGEIARAMADVGGENPAITLPVLSGPKSACPHALASRKRIEKGEIVNIDICGVFNRYHANTARTLSMGRPRPDVARVITISAGAFDVLKDLVRPGLAVDELNQRMTEYYRAAGIEQDKMWFGGYELGIAFPPDWVGSFVYDPAVDCGDERFEAGTVVNYESNFYLPEMAGVSLLINTITFDRSAAGILGRVPNDLIEIDR